jgi:hypothetical protein
MMNPIDPNNRPKGPPLSGGPHLVRDDDGFLRRELPESVRLSLAFKEAYVLELIEAEADPHFSRCDEYLQVVIERVNRRFVHSGQCDGFVVAPPSPKALRRWHWQYVEADCNPLALLPARPRPNRAKAPSET